MADLVCLTPKSMFYFLYYQQPEIRGRPTHTHKKMSMREKKEQEVDLKVFTEEKKSGRINSVKPGVARNRTMTRRGSCFHGAYWVEEAKGIKAAMQPNFPKCSGLSQIM